MEVLDPKISWCLHCCCIYRHPRGTGPTSIAQKHLEPSKLNIASAGTNWKRAHLILFNHWRIEKHVSLLKVKKRFKQNKPRCGISKQAKCVLNKTSLTTPIFFSSTPINQQQKLLWFASSCFSRKVEIFAGLKSEYLCGPVNLSPNFSNLPNSRPNLSEIFVGFSYSGWGFCWKTSAIEKATQRPVAPLSTPGNHVRQVCTKFRPFGFVASPR